MISLKSFFHDEEKQNLEFFSKAKQSVIHSVPALFFFSFRHHTESNQW